MGTSLGIPLYAAIFDQKKGAAPGPEETKGFRNLLPKSLRGIVPLA